MGKVNGEACGGSDARGGGGETMMSSRSFCDRRLLSRNEKLGAGLMSTSRRRIPRAVSRTIYEPRLAALCDSLIQESEVAYRRRLL